jgi:hypothetical protein
MKPSVILTDQKNFSKFSLRYNGKDTKLHSPWITADTSKTTATILKTGGTSNETRPGCVDE